MTRVSPGITCVPFLVFTQVFPQAYRLIALSRGLEHESYNVLVDIPRDLCSILKI
jgi:hypothetical protein